MTPRQTAVALFLFGLGANIYYQIMGYLAFTEIALIIIVPAALIFGGFEWQEHKIRVCVTLLALWLGSALLTDFLRGTFWQDALRGASRPIFLGAVMLVAYRLLRPNPGAAVWFYLGLIISNTISMYAFKPGSIDVTEQFYDITISGEFEKQGIGIVMSVLPCLLFWKGSRYPMVMGSLTAVVGILSVFLGSRSAGGIMFVAGIAVVITYRFLPIGTGRFQLPMRTILLLLLVGAVGALGALELYKTAASKGWLGEVANKKYFEQSQNRFGLLLGGRMDVLSGVLAIADSPVIGHGSWPLDTKGYMVHAAEIANADLDPAYREALDAGLVRIPAHSQILEPWVEHGLFASFFWLYLVWLLIRCSLQGVFVRPVLFPAVVLLLLSRWWDMLFSPFGGRVAVGTAFALFLVLVELVDEDSKKRTGVPTTPDKIRRPDALVRRRRFIRARR
jgi:hypothetical protein